MSLSKVVGLFAQVYRLAFVEYFLLVRRRHQIILIVAWLCGCAVASYFAVPVSMVLVVASLVLLTACMLGIWAYIGYGMQQRTKVLVKRFFEEI